MKKTICALLSLLMLAAPLASCSDTSGDDTPSVDDTTAADTTAAVVEETTPAETGRSAVKDNIPDDFTMNGQVLGVYIRDAVRQLDWDGGGEESGDVIFDTVYERTRAVEERLDVGFELTSITGTWKEFGNGMEQNIMAGDDAWQIVFTTGNAAIQSSRDHLFQDLSNNKYIDFDQPWWWKSAMEELSLDGQKIRYLVGDIHLYNYTKAGAMYFNKDIIDANGYNSDDLYKTVIDREWTYDLLREMSEAVYNDLNGDGEVNDGDLYGLIVDNVEYIRHMEFSLDVRHFSRDENGYPSMDYDTERAELAVTKLNALLYETKGNIYLNTDVTPANFAEQKTVFYTARLDSAISATFREMEADYGIIPYPMLDENQKEYTNLIHNSSDYVTIPVTCKTPDEVGAVIEALCSESYRTVIEPFYESALKSKYSRDSYSGQCIDIIRDVSVKNFLYEYNGVVKGGVMIADQVKGNTNNFASAYAKQVDATNKSIAALIEKYIKADADLAG